MRVLLIEPWYGGSHRAWADGYRRHSRHEVVLVTHPADFWRWRMRGGSVTLAERVDAEVARHGRPDVVVVSGLVDLAALLGLTRRSVGDVPVALYLHESQLSYPVPGDGRPDVAAGLVNWVGMVAADRVYVNSEYHRRTLAEALPGLLDQAPDLAHHHRLDEILDRTSVLPVGVELEGIGPAQPGADRRPLVLWSHRWDDDKNPRAFFAALERLDAAGAGFRLAVTGENRWTPNEVFDRARLRLGHRIDSFGHLPRPAYVELLARADIVVSCARHEFFGVAMVEAMAAGAIPVLPTRLSYPELVPEALHPWCLYPDGALRTRLGDVLADPGPWRSAVAGLPAAMRRFGWDVMAPRYDAELADLAG